VQPFWVHAGLVAVHVGPYEYTFDAIAAFDRILVDHWGEFKHTSLKSLFRMYRAGRLKEGDVWADLTDLVLERKITTPGESVFVNVFGLSIFDVAVSARMLRTAERMGVGRVLPLYGREENKL
jgi:ornithine cyclodeaminase